MKRLLLAIFCLLIGLMVSAQELDSLLLSSSAEEEGFQPFDTPEPMHVLPTDFDLHLLDWSLSLLDTTTCPVPAGEPLPDEVYRQRLAALPCVIEMPYNPIIRSYIDYYVLRHPRQLATIKRLSDYYFPIFEDRLLAYGLPLELRCLPVIESALNSAARSRVGAAGLWQFMPSTGKLYGLEVNSLIDERLDPHASTEAACKMLSSLYRLFGDWNLVIAAYNCGPGNVNKAIRRAGGKRDFWSIYPFLPAETRSYLPWFVAANYAIAYSDVHGICPDTLQTDGTMMHKQQYLHLVTDTIRTSSRQHLLQISSVLELPIEQLRKLNPQYTHDLLPGDKERTLVLPLVYAGAYIDNEDSILSYKRDSLTSQRLEATAVAASSAPTGSSYKVKSGDTLGAIAKRYGCSVKQLQQWNGLKNTNIRVGQVLRIRK